MGTPTSACLSKYCEKRGNRLVFRNGMSLNEFAWEMWEKLGCREIDPSVLSRAVSGRRRLTPPQLQVFAQILNLSPAESANLQTEYCREVLTGTGMEEPLVSSFLDHVDELEKGIEMIEQARSHDALNLSYLWTTHIENQITSRIDASNSSHTRNRLYSLWSQLIAKKGWILTEYCHARQLVTELSLIPQTCEKMAEITGNPQYKGLALAFTGRILFHQQEYGPSFEFDSAALNYLKDPEVLLWTLGRITLNLALSGQSRKISEFESRTESCISDMLTQRHHAPTDPLAFNQYFLNHRRLAGVYTVAQKPGPARKHLDTAWEIYSKHLAPNEGNFKHRARIELYHNEDLFHSHFKTATGPSDQMREETRQLVDLFCYRQYAVEPGPPSISKQL